MIRKLLLRDAQDAYRELLELFHLSWIYRWTIGSSHCGPAGRRTAPWSSRRQLIWARRTTTPSPWRAPIDQGRLRARALRGRSRELGDTRSGTGAADRWGGTETEKGMDLHGGKQRARPRAKSVSRRLPIRIQIAWGQVGSVSIRGR
jgi:hypothetical protein